MEALGKIHILYPSRSTEIELCNFGDFHMFNKGCALKRLRRDIKTASERPNTLLVGTGDYAEFIGYTDPRFDPSCLPKGFDPDQLHELGLAQMKAVRDLLAPCVHQIVGLGMGNHEYKYMSKQQQMFLHGWLCNELHTKSLGYSSIFDLVFHRVPSCKRVKLAYSVPPALKGKAKGLQSSSWTVRVVTHHGAGASRSEGGKMNKLVQLMRSFDADVFFMGHIHDQIAKRIDTVGANARCNRLAEHSKIGVVCGSYLRTYAKGTTSYGERAMYSPTHLGRASIRIIPDKKVITADV